MLGNADKKMILLLRPVVSSFQEALSESWIPFGAVVRLRPALVWGFNESNDGPSQDDPSTPS